LQLREQLVGRARHAQVDVFRRAGAIEAQLQHEASFQRRGVAHRGDDAREKPIEHQELSTPREVGTDRRLEPLFERLLERLG
jgi:hypothetical protein